MQEQLVKSLETEIFFTNKSINRNQIKTDLKQN